MKHSVTTRKINDRRGNTLLMSVIFLLAVSVIVISAFDRATQNISVTSRRINDPVTTSIAESGIEKAVYCLNNLTIVAPTCPRDTQGKYIGETNMALGRGKYTSSVVQTGQTATITVTATTAGLGGGSVKEIQAILTQAASLNPAFQFGVQTGEGGIEMSNNAKVLGNVYTNGSITGANGSSITGDAVLAVGPGTVDAVSDPSVTPTMHPKNLGDAANTVYLAQKFKSGVNDSVNSIEFKLAKFGAVPAMKVYIYTDVNDAPGTNISGTGLTLVTTSFPDVGEAGWETRWIKQVFVPNTILLKDTSYWLVLNVASSNSSKYWITVRGADGSDDSVYPDGTARFGSGLGSNCGSAGNLCPLNYDIAFQINVGGQEPTLEVPKVGGSAYSHIIKNTTVGLHAYYQVLSGTVKANADDVKKICLLKPIPETCTLSSSAGSCCHPASDDKPPQNFPISDSQIAQMETIAAAGGEPITCSPTCVLTNGAKIGPRKYIGNVTTTNGAIVTLAGTVWIAGNFTLSNDAVLQLDPGYGAENGIVIVDNPADKVNSGRITFNNNGDLRGSSNASCTGSPKRCSDGLNKNNTCSTASDCPMNSIMTISMNADPALTVKAIDVANNLTAGVLYAPYGLVHITNNASLKEVTAQKLLLANNTSITYMTGLASAIFSSGPGASWQLKPGTYRIIK